MSQEKEMTERLEEEKSVEELKKLLEETKAKADANLAGWQRAEADFSNFKKRVEQERSEAARMSLALFISELLGVVDDLERALATVPSRHSATTWVEGLRLIQRKLHTLLERHGVTVIKALGQPFDPSLHEAIKYEEGEEGKVLAESQKGYRLFDRVLRPALVVVGRGAKEAVEPENNGQDKAI